MIDLIILVIDLEFGLNGGPFLLRYFGQSPVFKEFGYRLVLAHLGVVQVGASLRVRIHGVGSGTPLRSVGTFYHSVTSRRLTQLVFRILRIAPRCVESMLLFSNHWFSYITIVILLLLHSVIVTTHCSQTYLSVVLPENGIIVLSVKQRLLFTLEISAKERRL